MITALENRVKTDPAWQSLCMTFREASRIWIKRELMKRKQKEHLRQVRLLRNSPAIFKINRR